MAAEQIIWVTEAELQRERTQVKLWRAEENAFWPSLRRAVGNRNRNEQSARRYQHEFSKLAEKGWVYLSGAERNRYLRLRDTLISNAQMRQASWATEVGRIVKNMRQLLDQILAEEERISRKRVKPKDEEWIGNEECSGYDLFYRLAESPLPEDGANHEGDYIVRDPESRDLIRIEKKLCLELTASIETSEGHDTPVAVEITCTTYVKEKDLSDLITTERTVLSGLIDWLISQGWGSLMKAFQKEGVAYNGEIHIETKGWYSWQVPDYPKVYVYVEKNQPRSRGYEGEFQVVE